VSGPVVFWVQHLLGVGHQQRSAAIARSCAEAGLDVIYVSGGMPVKDLDLRGCDFRQLPACRTADASFSGLVDAMGEPVGEAFLAARGQMLSDLLRRVRPSVFVTETYPFGRKPFGTELDPALVVAGETGVCVASVRDILVRKPDPAKYRRSADIAEKSYKAVLVHEPDGLDGFDRSYPYAGRISSLLRRTGYVTGTSPDPVADEGPGKGEVLISGGGSAVALPLYRAAVRAGREKGPGGPPWRILVGAGVNDATFDALAAEAGPGLVVERARPDFTAMLTRARLSVSLAGYNTVTECLQAGIRMVLAPFAEAGETEQADRAAALQRAGRATVLPLDGMDAANLTTAIGKALAGPAPDIPADWFSGAQRSAEIIAALARNAGD
jgi:predicted glycosyltransferase